MRPMSRLAVWLGPIRAPFLVLSPLLTLLGSALAWHDGMFRLSRLLLAALGVTLAHASVNLLNELSDYRTGIDQQTNRTPFSGGSGTLPAGRLSPRAVSMAAWGSLLGALAIAIVFTATVGWLVIPFAVLGALASVLYTTHLARFVLGELAAGLTLGSLVVLGTYYVHAGRLSVEAVLVSIPPGMLREAVAIWSSCWDDGARRCSMSRCSARCTVWSWRRWLHAGCR
jgi:1,4-dihydroxy-2-naphthoate octaprenyltransferase